MRIARKTITFYYVALTVLTLIGGFLRFYNLNWDQGLYFHPDERNIAAAVARLRFFDQLDPGFFAYGGFSIYLIRAIGELLARITSNPLWLADWGHINLIARSISALSATLLIPLVYYLARKLFGQKTGLIASFFVAFLPSLVQTAHFGVTENLLTFFITLIVALCTKTTGAHLKKSAMIVGAVYGVALATKMSAVSFFTPIFLSSFVFKNQRYGPLLFLVKTAIVTFLFFCLLSPYTFLNWNKFYESINYESGVVNCV